MTKLNDLCELIVDCEHKTAPIQEEGYPSIRTPNIGRGYFLLDGVNRVSAETYAEWTSRATPQGRDLILAREAPVGNVAVIPDGHQYCLGQRTVLIRPNQALVDSDYLCYLLLTPHMQGQLHGKAAGATVHHLNMKDIRALLMPDLPDLREQIRTASVIKAYDDLIATNQRRIALLEDAARLLYREWFVHLRFPGHELVPVWDGVPQDWRRVQLADMCLSLEDGDWIESKDQGGNDYRLLQVSNIGIGNFVETGNFRFISEDTFRRLRCRAVEKGDFLISRMPSPVGRAWLVGEKPWKMITAVDVAIAKHAPLVVDPLFLLHHLNSEENLKLSLQNSTGSTRLRISKKQLATLPALLPPLDLQKNFAAQTIFNIEQCSVLERQNELLARARDLLLPKLMSGQLDVSTIPLPDEVPA